MTAPILRYQAQIQEQQQEVPAAAPAAAAPPAPAAMESVDDLIGDILKTPAPKGDTEESDDAPEEPAADEAPEDAPEDDGDAGDPDDSDAADDAPADDADEEETEPSAAQLKAARKALKEGDLDKAFQLAFGKKPEEVQPDSKAWTAWRKANERKETQLAAERQAVAVERHEGQQWVAEQRQQLQGVINQLKPYDAYFQLEQAFARDGDPAHLVKIVELASKMTYDDAQKAMLTKARRSPGERALQQQVQTLMQKLEEAERKKAEEAQQQSAQQVYQSDLGTIRSELKGEVTRVPRFAERVYKVLVDTKAPTGLTLTIAQAGERVLANERRKLAKHPLLKKPAAPTSPVSQAASTLAKAKKGKTGAAAPALRRDSRGNGATDEKTETVDDIIGDILKTSKHRRLAR